MGNSENDKRALASRFLQYLSLHKELLLVCTLGFLVRLWFIPYIMSMDDLYTWRNIGRAICGGHLLDFYHTYLKYRYPPLWGYVCAVSYKIASIFVEEPVRVNDIHFLTWIKMPLIVSDIALGTFLYKFVIEFTKDKRQALLASIIFIFNPIVIFITAYWGMFDGLCLLFLVMAEYYLIKGRLGPSAVMNALAVLTKQYAYPLALVSGLIVLRERGWKKGVAYLAAICIIFGFFSVPYLLSEPHEYLDAVIYTEPAKILRTAKGGFGGILYIGQRWGLFYVPEFLNGTYSYLLYAVFLLWFGFFAIRRIEVKDRTVNDVMVMLALTFLTLSPYLHSNYFFLCVPFICLSVALRHHSPLFYAMTVFPITVWVYGFPFIEDPERLWSLSFATLNCLSTFAGQFSTSMDVIEASFEREAQTPKYRRQRMTQNRETMQDMLKTLESRPIAPENNPSNVLKRGEYVKSSRID